MYRFQGYEIDEDRLEIRLNGEAVPTEPQVFSLLLCLVENRDRVVSKDDLIDAVWNGRIVSDATLNSRVNALRRAVGDTGKLQQVIKTYPRRGFRFVADLETPQRQEKPSSGAEPARERPSIVILPFEHVAATDDHAYLARGITEEVTTALSRMRWLFVISQTTSSSYGSDDWQSISNELAVDYVLTGSVHTAGDDIRVSARLTDTDACRQVWADRFGGKLADVFELHDDIAFAIVTHLEPEITRAEIERLRRRSRPGDLTAWEHYLRAVPHFARLEQSENEAARTELLRAVEIDPDFVLPHVALAWNWAMAAMHGWCEKGSEALSQSAFHARNALKLDPGDGRAYCAMAFVEFWTGKQQKAVENARQSLDLDPNMTDAHGMLGAAQALSGAPDAAIAALERALSGSPRDPIRWFWYQGLANASFAREDYDQASAWADKVIADQPTFPGGHLVKAASLVHGGDVRAAEETVKSLIEFAPHYTLKRVMRNPIWTDSSAFDRLVSGAKKAGLPS